MPVATVLQVSRAHMVYGRIHALGISMLAPGDLGERVEDEQLTLQLHLDAWERLIDLAEQALG